MEAPNSPSSGPSAFARRGQVFSDAASLPTPQAPAPWSRSAAEVSSMPGSRGTGIGRQAPAMPAEQPSPLAMQQALPAGVPSAFSRRGHGSAPAMPAVVRPDSPTRPAGPAADPGPVHDSSVPSAFGRRGPGQPDKGKQRQASSMSSRGSVQALVDVYQPPGSPPHKQRPAGQSRAPRTPELAAQSLPGQASSPSPSEGGHPQQGRPGIDSMPSAHARRFAGPTGSVRLPDELGPQDTLAPKHIHSLHRELSVLRRTPSSKMVWPAREATLPAVAPLTPAYAETVRLGKLLCDSSLNVVHAGMLPATCVLMSLAMWLQAPEQLERYLDLTLKLSGTPSSDPLSMRMDPPGLHAHSQVHTACRAEHSKGQSWYRLPGCQEPRQQQFDS